MKRPMKPGRLLLVIAAMLIAAGAYAQQVNRGDLCQDIPGLTASQQKKIDELGKAHQKKMDHLRTRFYAETDPVDASTIKTEMSTERNKHYQNISALLTPEQQQWYDQQCYANENGRYLRQGNGRGNGRGMGRGMGRGAGIGSDRGMGRGAGRGAGRGYGYRQI
ncbi:MAG: hypothetical protein ABFS28_15630 [Bacteroidota bacterium]